MAGEWYERQFGDCAVLVRETVSPGESAGVPYIGLEHIAEGGLSLLGYGTADDVTSIKSRFRAGDVLFGKLRPYFRKVIRAPFDGVCSTDIWVVRPRDDMDAGFLFYWMASRDFVDASMRGSEGTKMPRAKWDFVARISQVVPPLPEQRDIAHILGTLDDKIELNRRLNETLEAIARALFKSWFVDFDPVRRNMARNGRGQPSSGASRHPLPKVEGSEHRPPTSGGGAGGEGCIEELDALFPDSFEDSELGEIPKGWKATRWGALVSLEYGKSLGGYAGDYGAYPVYGTNGKIGSHSEPLCNHPGIIIGRKGAYRGVHFCSTPFFVIDTAFYVEPKSPAELRWAYYELLRQDINSMDSGSAIPSTSREDFYSLPVLYPPFEVQQAFVQLLKPCWARREQNNNATRTLAALRDTLLPKLISGELRVRGAERFIAEVGL